MYRVEQVAPILRSWQVYACWEADPMRVQNVPQSRFVIHLQNFFNNLMVAGGLVRFPALILVALKGSYDLRQSDCRSLFETIVANNYNIDNISISTNYIQYCQAAAR